MTREQAVRVVAFLNAAFPRDTLEEATVDLYLDELEGWDDADAAFEAARLTVRQGSRFPSLSELRLAYRQRVAAVRAAVPALPEARHEVPEWVRVWSWARGRGREARSFPQQGSTGLSVAEFEALRDEWRAEDEASRSRDVLREILDRQPKEA